MYHELEHLKMCLGTVIDMNETFNVVTGEVLVDRSHGCAHDAAAGTETCIEWCSSYLWWKS